MSHHTVFAGAVATAISLVAFEAHAQVESDSDAGAADLADAGAPATAATSTMPATTASPTSAPNVTSDVAAPPAGEKPSNASEQDPPFEVKPLGYVEAYYAYNFNRPSNGITNFRGFDNRHNSFALQNVALGANFTAGPVGGRIILQVGSEPSTYYSGEPNLPGSNGANAGNGDLWKYLQEAFVTYKAPIGRGLLFQLGLCASPIGFEVFAVKDNWNWSRSNVFYGLPFYHTGLRATYEWSDQWATTVSVFNGWNSVIDNNEEKSVEGQVNYKIQDNLQAQVLYFGGVERNGGAPEGPYWRHHFDAFAQYDATNWISFAGEGDYGWEPNRFGTAKWAAGALYARVMPIKHMYFALRGDELHEDVATNGSGSSAPIFWGGVTWLSSGTATIDVRPHDQISIRLEYRHDLASSSAFFGRNVQGDGSTGAPFIANARTQDTLLLGATAWF